MALHIADPKNTVEHIVVATALVDPLPDGGSLRCLGREHTVGGEVPTVLAQGYGGSAFLKSVFRLGGTPDPPQAEGQEATPLSRFAPMRQASLSLALHLCEWGLHIHIVTTW